MPRVRPIYSARSTPVIFPAERVGTSQIPNDINRTGHAVLIIRLWRASPTSTVMAAAGLKWSVDMAGSCPLERMNTSLCGSVAPDQPGQTIHSLEPMNRIDPAGSLRRCK